MDPSDIRADGRTLATAQKESTIASLTRSAHPAYPDSASRNPIDVDVPIKGNHVPARQDTTRQVRTTLKRILKPLDALYPIERRLDLGPFVHWRGNASSPMHRWLRYREAYSPALIDKLQLGHRILDPFAGCGSIPIGAATRGRTALGIDLNPIATFSTKVKLSPLKNASIRRLQRFIEAIPQLALNENRWPMPDLSISEKVFEPAILDALMKIRSALEHEFATDPDARNFALLAWVAILEGVGSYFKEGNGIKYRNKRRQQGKYTNRPDGEWQLARFGPDQKVFVLNAFVRHLQLMIEDTTQWSSGSWKHQRIIEGSAFDLSALVQGDTFDSVIFSPPYANRFDYFESFKVELWFGNFVNSYAELNSLRKASLRSHLNADFKRSSDYFPPLEDLIALMDRDASSWRMGVPDLMRGYFHDIGVVLRQCRQAVPNGRCHVVVGNSAFGGVIIPTDVLTAMVGIQAGFSQARLLETRHLTVAPQQRSRLKGFEAQMRESIVILE